MRANEYKGGVTVGGRGGGGRRFAPHLFAKVAGTPQGSLHYCRLLNCGSVFSTGRKCETYTAPSYVQSKIHQPRLDINAARFLKTKHCPHKKPTTLTHSPFELWKVPTVYYLSPENIAKRPS